MSAQFLCEGAWFRFLSTGVMVSELECERIVPILEGPFQKRGRQYWRWLLGSCNLALLSYVEGNSRSALSLSRWEDIYLAGYTLVQACLNLHTEGGAATVIGKLQAKSLLFGSSLNLFRMIQVPMATLFSPCSYGKMGLYSTVWWTSTRAHHFPQALIPDLQQS